MTKPMVRIHNSETDQVIDREMTAAEFADYEAKINVKVLEEAAKTARDAKRQDLFDRLGITAEEAQLLLS